MCRLCHRQWQRKTAVHRAMRAAQASEDDAQMASGASGPSQPAPALTASPGCVRRVRTDLKTSENRFLGGHQPTLAMRHRQQHCHTLLASSAPSANATYLRWQQRQAGTNRALTNPTPLFFSSCSAKLPARANRLLNRSRLQDQQQQQQLQTGNDSDNSLRSTHSGNSAGRKRSSTAASNASSTSSLQRRQQHQQQQQLSASASGSRRGAGNAELHSSSDDLMLYDKSFRNAMIQDVLQFKKQLLRLRRILQEVRHSLPRPAQLSSPHLIPRPLPSIEKVSFSVDSFIILLCTSCLMPHHMPPATCHTHTYAHPAGG